MAGRRWILHGALLGTALSLGRAIAREKRHLLDVGRLSHRIIALADDLIIVLIEMTRSGATQADIQ